MAFERAGITPYDMNQSKGVSEVIAEGFDAEKLSDSAALSSRGGFLHLRAVSIWYRLTINFLGMWRSRKG